VFSGNTTYANTQTLLIGDNILTLNADLPTNVVPSENAGIEVNRGTSTNVSLIWNETQDKWNFTNDGTTFYAIPTNAAAELAQTTASAAFDKANSANSLAYNTGLGANAFTSATIAGANTAVGAGANAYAATVGTAGNTFLLATIAGANTAVGAGANAYAAAAAAGANAYMIAVQNGSNTAIGTGANAFASATIAGANTAVGTGANNYSNATFVKLVAGSQTITGNLSVSGIMSAGSAANANVYVTDSTTTMGMGVYPTDGWFGTVTADTMYIRTSGVNRMRFGSTGGITTDESITTNNRIEIAPSAGNADFYFTSNVALGGRRWLMNSGINGNWSIYDSTGANTRLSISSGGTARMYTATGNLTHEFGSYTGGNFHELKTTEGNSGTEIFADTNSGIIGFQGNFYIANANSVDPDIVFQLGPSYTEYMRLNPSGNLLIGRTNSTVGQNVKLDVNGAVNASALLVNGTPITGGSASLTVAADTVNATRYIMFANGTTGSIATLNVSTGMTFNPSTNAVTISGALNAVTKSFVIDHPIKPNMKLRYGSLEGPENGVYVRGRLDGESIIELPDYWWNLIDEQSITVNLTPIGKSQDLWVQSTSARFVHLNQPAECFFTVFAERKDVDKLVVEF
jgi:hypothetical protein